MADRILVIDDTQVIRKFLEEVLTDSGFEVDTAADGKEGFEMVLANDYAMIFCDVHMPVMNGLQAVSEIKAVRPDVPIIMTDSFPEREAEEAAQMGAICCLTKPFDLQELKKTVNRILKKKVLADR
ncbi:putative FOG: CheY-like receiver [Candidatus Zixiibacteriota bacterium]|nr:putative FOG: CheY-like receiver [candidate division Zixibacteria bacterium]